MELWWGCCCCGADGGRPSGSEGVHGCWGRGCSGGPVFGCGTATLLPYVGSAEDGRQSDAVTEVDAGAPTEDLGEGG